MTLPPIVRDTWTEKFFDALGDLLDNCPADYVVEEMERKSEWLAKFATYAKRSREVVGA